MAWNYQSSLERIEQHVETLQDIEVEKLVREADLEGLLSETVRSTVLTRMWLSRTSQSCVPTALMQPQITNGSFRASISTSVK